jgi:hypothetical protein
MATRELHAAIQTNDRDEVERQLINGVDPYVTDDAGWTAFAMGVIWQRWNIIWIMLRNCPRRRLSKYAGKHLVELIVLYHPPITLVCVLFKLIEDPHEFEFDCFPARSIGHMALFVRAYTLVNTSWLYTTNIIEYLLTQGGDINQAFAESLAYFDHKMSLYLLSKGARFRLDLIPTSVEMVNEVDRMGYEKRLLKLRDWYNLVVLCSVAHVPRLGTKSVLRHLGGVDLIRALAGFIRGS